MDVFLHLAVERGRLGLQVVRGQRCILADWCEDFVKFDSFALSVALDELPKRGEGVVLVLLRDQQA